MGLETALLIGSLVASVGGAIYQGVQQSKAEKYNAAVAEAEAGAARQKAAYDEEIHRGRVKKLLSQQRALYGKSGVSQAGSPLLVLEDTAAQGELDALAIRYGGEVRAGRSESEADLSRQRSRTARTSGYVKAGSSLLTGANRVRGSL